MRSWKHALQLIISAHNDRHARKPKGVSMKTRSERACALFRCFRDLHALGFKIKKPERLGGRHVAALVEDWTAEQPRARQHTLSPATIQTELSHLRTFAAWIGKPGLVRAAEDYVATPAQVRRQYVATVDRSWPAQHVDQDVLIEAVAREDAWVGAELRLACAFGLRVKETVMIQPRLAERTATGAPSREAEIGNTLEVVRGTKGGRRRLVPIDSPGKRAALEAAKAIVATDAQPLADPERSLKQNLDRVYRVLRKFGVTRRSLGVTAHGLRHGYAADRYQGLTGAQAPVRDGAPPAPDVDRDARLRIAEELGHGRPQITKAYLGQSAVMRSKGLKPSDPPMK